MRPVIRKQRGRQQAGLVAAVTAATLVMTGWVATSSSAAPGNEDAPAEATSSTTAKAPHQPEDPASGGPILTPEDGAFLEGTAAVAAVPVAPGDDVESLTVDGTDVPGATETLGTAVLGYDVGSNSTEARYQNYVSVNGSEPIHLPDAAGERVELEIPNEYLVTGENVVEVVAGTFTTSCGANHDDFVLSDFTLEPLGEMADGEENEYTYAFGDGSCGTNTTLLRRAELSFFLQGDPQDTTGLSADLDTTTLANGEHTIEARTASGDVTAHTVRVNNAPTGAPRLTPVDGTLTNGAVVVTGARPADGDGGTAELTVDGEAVETTDTLGSGDAAFSFDVGSNSVDGRAANLLVVNGIETPLGGSYSSRRVDVTIPNEWLRPGENTVQVVTGTFADDCNRDDFTISDLALTPAAGTASGVGLEPTYRMGDGTCGSNTSLLREITATFEVDAAARGLRADLDTATLPDGEHELAATSTTGETAVRALFTDNTGPALVTATPADGDRLTSSVPLAVSVDDASGVVQGPDITLDGEEITVGDPVGPGLSAGGHTLAVSATDGLGNQVTHEIPFVSAGIPDVPADVAPASGASDVRRAATLSAKVAEPDGGKVTTTFSSAEILTPTRAWQGESDGVPTDLRVPGQEKLSTRALEPGDGRSADSPTSSDVTYQRFDVPVRGKVEAPVLRWEGTADPARLVSLRAWNPDNGAWDVVASARGAVDGATVLEGTVTRDYVDRGKVHAMVTGEDPFADDIDAGDGDRFANPDDYDFSMVHYTDTQYLSEGAVEQETAEERAVWGKAYTGVMDWIVDNAEERKIAYVAHTGDIIENNIRSLPPELEDQVAGEFEFASEAQGRIDAAGIPNGVVAGNHDNQSGTDPELFDQHFGPGRYEELAKGWENATYGGSMEPGSNENHYDLFSAGGLDFVVVGLSYGVTRDEAEWAAEIFDRYSDRNGILLTHDYLEPSSSPDGRGANFGGSDGPLLYNLLVKDNPNVFMVLAGHRHGVGTNVRPPVVGDIGGGVVELLADYQFYTVSADQLGLTEIGGYKPTDRLRLGASFFRMLQFDVDRGEVSIDTYSPLLGEFGATEYDEDQRYNGLEDNMVLPVDLTSRTTTLSTESVVLYDPVHQIGEVTVSSGEVASVRWDRLKPGRTYAWFVTARTAGGGSTTAPPAYFTTARR
ncbi:Calcineurin-like phosphoesterase [Promicromonospora umidemergens]|uniref:Calcineurin-like phosphoesterase domain-containing protein n=1 Tax=Promicromonospora umidemergens TaxID=629679 RepID=A0ABP8WRD5_9MICO|nr:metallophosphoesterase [Promicromonospora umidemergens]MCP2283251.1 Calcineurin-like phosphoesterase [Promicromonospora umidemergens]